MGLMILWSTVQVCDALPFTYVESLSFFGMTGFFIVLTGGDVARFYETDETHSHAFVDYISRNVLHTLWVSG